MKMVCKVFIVCSTGNRGPTRFVWDWVSNRWVLPPAKGEKWSRRLLMTEDKVDKVIERNGLRLVGKKMEIYV